MKFLAIVACAALLTGCGTLGGLTGEEKLAVLKGASEHLQTCTRIYNLNSGFPPTTSVAITCMPTPSQVTAVAGPPAMTPETVAMIAAETARKVLEEFTGPRNP